MEAGLHHIHIKSRSPRDSARWWADMFGAELLPETEFRDMVFAPVRLDGVQITITGLSEAEAAATADPPAIPYFGLEHVGILVDDLDGVLDRFRSEGLPVYERREGAGGFEIAFVGTPDGVCLELLQQPSGEGSSP